MAGIVPGFSHWGFMATHTIKVFPPHYARVANGSMTFLVKDNEVDYVAGPRRVMLCVGFGVEDKEFSFASTIIFEDDQDNPMTSEEGNGQLRTWLSLMFIQAIEKRLSR